VEVRQTSNLRRLRIGEEKARKKKERKKNPQDEIPDESAMACPIGHKK